MKGKDTRRYPYRRYPPAARCYWRREQDRPQHRELRALRFATSVWGLKRPTVFKELWILVRRGLWFRVLIREGFYVNFTQEN